MRGGAESLKRLHIGEERGFDEEGAGGVHAVEPEEGGSGPFILEDGGGGGLLGVARGVEFNLKDIAAHLLPEAVDAHVEVVEDSGIYRPGAARVIPAEVEELAAYLGEGLLGLLGVEGELAHALAREAGEFPAFPKALLVAEEIHDEGESSRARRRRRREAAGMRQMRRRSRARR